MSGNCQAENENTRGGRITNTFSESSLQKTWILSLAKYEKFNKQGVKICHGEWKKGDWGSKTFQQ